MLVSTNAIVLSKLKYRDNDLILKCYTESFGVVSYILRGVLNSKKSKFKLAYLQPLTQLHLNASHKENRGLQSLNDIKLIVPYDTLHSNIYKSAMVMFLSEVLIQILHEEEENRALYSFISTSLEWLDKQTNAPNFHLYFLLKITKYLGFYPDITNEERDHFNLEEGKFEIAKTSLYTVSGQNLILLKVLLGIKFDALNAVKISSNQRHDFLNMILLYFELHLGGFKKPKSLQILNQIFG